MIDALRRRADTHTPSSRLERSTFLGLPPPYGGFFASPAGADGSKAATSTCGGGVTPGSYANERSFMNCFFWCAQTRHPGDEDDGREDDEDVSLGLPDYLFGRRLGVGRQGEVRHAIRRSDGESVAVKCVKRHRHSAHEEENVLEEAAVLRRLSHSSVVRLYKFESLTNYHFLVLELLDGGEILDAVAELATYTEHDARQIAIAVLQALQHAHDQAKCIHRDLRPENLLLTRDPSAMARSGLGRRVKIAGWGRSKRLPVSGLVPGEHCFAKRAFCAPEMILEESHGASADMFAFGAILYTLLGGSPPRSATLVSAVNPTAPDTSGPAWGGVSSEAKALVGALMTPEGPIARMTASQALSHEWIQAGAGMLRARSLDAVLKGARVLSWRGAIESGNRDRSSGARNGIPRTVSMF